MNTSPIVRLPAAGFWVALAATACEAKPSSPELSPLTGEVSRFPAAETLDPESADGEANPWLVGFGGAAPLEPSNTGSPSVSPPGSEVPGLAASEPDGDGPERTTGESAMDPSPPTGTDANAVPSVEEPEALQRRFTRYLEGEGSDKLLGIWGEPGPSPVPCVVQIYSNGGTSPWRSVPLPDAFDTSELVFCSLPEEHSDCTESLSGSLYNGNDALVLDCGGEVLDSFGRVGEDPGSAWTSVDGLLRSEGQHLVRCGEASRTEPLTPFHLEDEWLLVETGESPEAARFRCATLGASGGGGAGGAPLR